MSRNKSGPLINLDKMTVQELVKESGESKVMEWMIWSKAYKLEKEVNRLKEFCRMIINHEDHFDHLGDSVRYAEEALNEQK